MCFIQYWNDDIHDYRRRQLVVRFTHSISPELMEIVSEGQVYECF
jgi:hypothetical protein